MNAPKWYVRTDARAFRLLLDMHAYRSFGSRGVLCLAFPDLFTCFLPHVLASVAMKCATPSSRCAPFHVCMAINPFEVRALEGDGFSCIYGVYERSTRSPLFTTTENFLRFSPRE